MDKPSFAVVGCGKVGSTLAGILAGKGWRVAGLASATKDSARNAARIAGAERYGTDAKELVAGADVVFITTPDDAIARVAEQLAGQGAFAAGAVVLHCSGSLPSEIMSPARDAGAAIGSAHPLQSVARIYEKENPIAGAYVAVEGDPKAVETGRAVAAALSANFAEIRAEAKTLYHAAAVVASNYLVTLLSMSTRFNELAGMSQADSIKALMPLIQGTLNNIQRQGIPDALTGPVARGDASTVRSHVAEIGEKAPDFLTLYQVLGRHTVDLARAKGGIDEDGVKRLEAALEG
ncbi:MAG: Rossmann-like and DUF2520 domain-containing protein [Desulfatibacillaceae bacterium]